MTSRISYLRENTVQLLASKYKQAQSVSSTRTCLNRNTKGTRAMATVNYTPQQLPLPIDDATVEIPLTKGYIATIDAVDADLTAFKWAALETKSGHVYAIHSVMSNGKKSHLYLHRVIIARLQNRELSKFDFIDHKDTNSLNNTRRNLRLATPAQNRHNSKRQSNNQSGYKGVCSSRNKWRAVIWLEGKSVRLGTFNTPEEAHQAYCNAAEQYYGEFARSE